MRFKMALRIRGVYTKPTPRDIWYVSTEHTDEDVDITLDAASRAVEDLSRFDSTSLTSRDSSGGVA